MIEAAAIMFLGVYIALLSWHYSREFARLSESLAIEREFADVARQQRQDAEQERDALAEALRTTQAERDEAEGIAADIERRCDVELARRSEAWKARIAELEREFSEVTSKGEQAHQDGWHAAKVMVVDRVRKVLHEASLERAPYHVTFDERLAAFHSEPGDFGETDSEGGEA